MRFFAPLGKGFDRSEDHQANPEIHDHPKIVFMKVLRSWREMGHQQKIHQVTQQHSSQRLQEIGYKLL